MKKEVKFIQTKIFRAAVTIVLAVLAVVLLSRNVLGSTVSLFTKEHETTEQAVIIPELQVAEEGKAPGLKEECIPVVMAAKEPKQEDELAQNSTEGQEAPTQRRFTTERVVKRTDVVAVEPQTDEDLDPYETSDETPDETPDPTPETTEAPVLDSTDQIESDQPGSGEPIEKDLEEEPSIEDSFVAFPLDEDLTATERSVSIRRVISNIVRDGDLFQIEATLVGFDGIEYELRWQYNDGSGWQNVPDADGATTLELIADRNNINYDWRILVTIVQTLIIESTTIE